MKKLPRNVEITLKKRIQIVAREVGETSSFVGLSKIILDGWHVKLIWIFFHICLTGVAIYLVTNNVLNYLKYDVITKVREINEFPTSFPVVTVCNINPFQTDYSVLFLQQVALSHGLLDPFNLTTTEQDDIIDNLVFVRLAIMDIIKNNLSNSEIQKLGYSFNETFFKCSFGLENCNQTRVKWFFHPQFGNCYQFSSDLPVFQTGLAGGLSLEAFVGVPKILEPYTTNFGLAVFVHTNTTSPLSIEPVMVGTNVDTYIVVSKVKTEKQEWPYSSCQTLDSVNSHLKDLILNQGIDYRQQDCIFQCYQMNLINRCSCYDINVANYINSSVSPCRSETSTCMTKINNEFLSPAFIEANCLSACPLECKSNYYTTSPLSSSFYPTPAYATQLLHSGRLNGTTYLASNFTMPLRSNILSLSVYFDSLSSTLISESVAIDVFTLISNVGGSIGLILGVSFFTAVELFELGVKILIVILDYRAEKRIEKYVPEIPNKSLSKSPMQYI